MVNYAADTTPVCHLDDAYACIKSLQDFVNLKSLKKLPCGCIANSTNDTKTEFCRSDNNNNIWFLICSVICLAVVLRINNFHLPGLVLRYHKNVVDVDFVTKI